MSNHRAPTTANWTSRSPLLHRAASALLIVACMVLIVTVLAAIIVWMTSTTEPQRAIAAPITPVVTIAATSVPQHAPPATAQPATPSSIAMATEAPVTDPPAAATAVTDADHLVPYTVQNGDTLTKIAEAHDLSLTELIDTNGIDNIDHLLAGETLWLPEGTTPVSTSPPTVPPTPIVPAPEPTSLVTPSVSVTRELEACWIDVDLSEQRVTAYEGEQPVHTALASTGLPQTPTPVGQYRIWIKLRTDDMAGPGYYIKDVPYVMYFHGGYGLHGVTWHGNFGHPMSHGCVNLPTEEAKWFFDWASVGTLVNIHD